MLVELRKVIPAFLRRVDMPERGGVWSAYLAETQPRRARRRSACWRAGAARGARVGARCARRRRGHADRLRSGRRGEGRGRRALRGHRPRPTMSCWRSARRMTAERARRRAARLRRQAQQPAPQARPRLRADVVPLRHARRLRRVPRSAAPPAAHARVAAALAAARLRHARGRSPRPAAAEDVASGDGRVGASCTTRSPRRGCPEVASYAVSMAYRVRFYMEMNAREAMHVIELRTAPQGHPAYRRVCQAHAPAHRRAGRPPRHRRRDDASPITRRWSSSGSKPSAPPSAVAPAADLVRARRRVRVAPLIVRSGSIHLPGWWPSNIIGRPIK